ncbi:unnamed protein product [Clonostachys rosea]|uniref:F-box domain-containing protein n=1 Tax=Bionectria ochroleuca TaxID=29856 RepID=A0ABY6V3Z5_BIOOC|nr:unnamed protein product [Clonostachys rosea]
MTTANTWGYGCALCGITVGGFPTDDPGEPMFWLKEFRGVYREGEQLVLTGVGRHDAGREGKYMAPLDPAVRWDDPSYDHPNLDDQFDVTRHDPNSPRHGTVLHNACWLLLKQYYAPREVPLERLYDVTASVPEHEEALNWGHDFGGLLKVNDDRLYPWEKFQMKRRRGSSVAYVNPMLVPQINMVINQELETPPSTLAIAPGVATNVLSRLPREVLDIIISLLPTVDVSNCRLASRLFCLSFNDPSFWRSRFYHSTERSWIFEALDPRRPVGDWRSLYRQTVTIGYLPIELQNRKRLWGLIDKLVPLLELSLFPVEDSIRVERGDSMILWNTAAANIEPQLPSQEPTLHIKQADDGCREFRSSQTEIPGRLQGFVFYFIKLGDREFLTGIQISTDVRDHLAIGYKSMSFARHSFTPSESSLFRGFCVAVGPQGIHAIQILSAGGGSSEWYGDASRCPMTRRSLCDGPVIALSVSLDGCKIISLGAAEIISGPQPAPLLPSPHQKGIWYPQPPPSEVRLLEPCLALKHFITEYSPIIWTHFGGPGGAYLPHLEKVTLKMTTIINEIRVGYHGRESTVLGDCDIGTEVPGHDFYIDGPAGERIQEVTAWLVYNTNPRRTSVFACGALERLEITTNRQRSHLFRPVHSPERLELREHRLSGPPGTTITGFYANHDYSGLTNLGIMYERIAPA